MLLLRLAVGLLISCSICRASGDEVTDVRLRKKLLATTTRIARVLNWSPVKNPHVIELRSGDRPPLYEVVWKKGVTFFSAAASVRSCRKIEPKLKVIWQEPSSIPKLSASEIQRAKTIAERVRKALDLGPIELFAKVTARPSRNGLNVPVVFVECWTKLNTPIPVHELTIPKVQIEIYRDSWQVGYVGSTFYPVIVEPLKLKEDKGKAKKLIAGFVRKQYGVNLNPAFMKVDLKLIDWYEGDETSIEAQRLRSIRRWLIPVYCYVEPKIGEIWFDANTMKLRGVREKIKVPPMSNKKATLP